MECTAYGCLQKIGVAYRVCKSWADRKDRFQGEPSNNSGLSVSASFFSTWVLFYCCRGFLETETALQCIASLLCGEFKSSERQRDLVGVFLLCSGEHSKVFRQAWWLLMSDDHQYLSSLLGGSMSRCSNSWNGGSCPMMICLEKN